MESPFFVFKIYNYRIRTLTVVKLRSFDKQRKFLNKKSSYSPPYQTTNYQQFIPKYKIKNLTDATRSIQTFNSQQITNMYKISLCKSLIAFNFQCSLVFVLRQGKVTTEKGLLLKIW